MNRLILSRSAELDLDEIDLYTVEHFGFAQAERTEAAFHETLSAIADNPGAGHSRPELDPPGRSFLYVTVLRRYLIVYAASDRGVRVARILDGSRDLHGLLSKDAGD
jgi:plasmid stabilization system protein ParE